MRSPPHGAARDVPRRLEHARPLPRASSAPGGPALIPPRTATLVVVGRDGEVLGRLPAIPLATPWWQDARPVVEGARRAFGAEVVVLRLLDAALPRPPGGSVTYLAQVREPLPRAALERLVPWAGPLDIHPLRMRWAVPGGPDADLEWASAVLGARGLEIVGPAEQIRTWNLSSIWRLPIRAGSAWLKVVPPFFAHEGDILSRLRGASVPELIGHDRDRMLLADIPGDDRYDAQLPELLEMVSSLVDLQSAWPGRVDELSDVGLPDWRAGPLTTAIAAVVERRGRELPAEDRRILDAFVADLPSRFAAIGSCGIPDTLVHGDFHPGNVRGAPAPAGSRASLILLDWGDSGIGHPLLDSSAFLDRIPAAAVVTVREHWSATWRTWFPGSDPDRSMALFAPVAAARQALIYQGFLDRIEPSERPYHRADPAEWLGRTAALLRSARGSGGA